MAPHLSRRRVGLAMGLSAASTAASTAGCSLLWRPSPVAMNVLYHLDACTTRAPVLLVLLPGAHMAPEELQQQGFVQQVRQRGLAVDVMLVDSHLGYVYDGSLFDRLHHDVLAPARAQGWQRIWLAGLSLGGYAAMGYAMRHPGMVEGIFALAPYLGRQLLVQDIAAAQAQGRSLQQWLATSSPRPGGSGEADNDHALWRWLVQRSVHQSVQRPAGAPLLHLAYGLRDRFAAGHALMAQTLPLQQVSTAPGGHDWPPWRTLWAQWLDQGLASGLWSTRCPA